MQEPAEGGGYLAWKTDAVLSVQDLNAVDSKLDFQVLFGGEVAKGTATKSGDVISFAEKTTQAAESATKSAKTA